MNPLTLQRRTRHSYPRYGRKTTEVSRWVSLQSSSARCPVIQFRFDEMTARQSLAMERRLASLSAAREPNRCPLRTAR
jgi:hypothetical protein